MAKKLKSPEPTKYKGVLRPQWRPQGTFPDAMPPVFVKPKKRKAKKARQWRPEAGSEDGVFGDDPRGIPKRAVVTSFRPLLRGLKYYWRGKLTGKARVALDRLVLELER